MRYKFNLMNMRVWAVEDTAMPPHYPTHKAALSAMREQLEHMLGKLEDIKDPNEYVDPNHVLDEDY